MAKRGKKAAALVDVPQSGAACDAKIDRIGELRRALRRREAAMNDELARIKAGHAEAVLAIQAELAAAERSVQAYCETFRAVLTSGGKTKTYRFNAGDVSWRTLPPSVTLRDVKRIVAHCQASKALLRFLRVRTEPDKEAMLKEPDVAVTIPGVSVGSEGEQFEIKPNEQRLEEVA